jgi:asparagine synthase (glutamine-hydrolysing)
MSGIVAIFNSDGAPADEALLRRMLAAAAYRGPDGVGVWRQGPIALGHLMLRTTPESLHETQPLLDGPGNLCLTFNGRLDNRDELIDLLYERGGADAAGLPDSAIVIRAYEHWGLDSVEHLRGEYAFALWDRRERRLVLVRDALGTRTLYYSWNGRTCVAASELHQVLLHPFVSLSPNEGMIGEYLCGLLYQKDETLFRDVRRLAPGEMAVVDAGGFRLRRYYEPQPQKVIQYRNPDEYVDHFLDVFGQAVRSRMRAIDGVGAQLSGGLDSSTVVGVAQSLRRRGEFSDDRFETFSLCFDDPACDERKYFEAVIDMCGVDAHVLKPHPLDMATLVSVIRRYRNFGEHPTSAIQWSVYSRMRERGLRVLLSGLGGDEQLSGSDQYYADLLWEWRIGELVRKYRTDRAFRILPGNPFLLLLRRAVWPLTPMRDWARRFIFVPRMPPSSIEPEFARRIGLPERIRAGMMPRIPRGMSFAQRFIYECLTMPWTVQVLENVERSASAFGCEYRHPFFDRRVIEFIMALPEEQRCDGEYAKVIVRNAGRRILPEIVWNRGDKAEFTSVVSDFFKRSPGESLFRNLVIESYGWINGDEVRRMYQRASNDWRCREAPILWQTMEMDLWCRQVIGSAAVGGTLAADNAPMNERVVAGG